MIRLVKFCIVGGCNTLVTLVVFYIMNKILYINYMFSSIIGYCLGVVNSYMLNKTWTFSDHEKRILPQLTKFVCVNSISLGVNLFAMYIFVDKLNFDNMLSQIIATVFSTFSNYTGSRLWVFRKLNIG